MPSRSALTIEDVRIRRTDLTKEVSQQTYDRMKAERLAEAELIRARGREAGQRIRAIADRQVVEFESKARRDSEIIRGEGDAERNHIFAEAFTKDEGFFDFLSVHGSLPSGTDRIGHHYGDYAEHGVLPVLPVCDRGSASVGKP